MPTHLGLPACGRAEEGREPRRLRPLLPCTSEAVGAGSRPSGRSGLLSEDACPRTPWVLSVGWVPSGGLPGPCPGSARNGVGLRPGVVRAALLQPRAPRRPRLAQFRARAGLGEPPWGAAPSLASCHPGLQQVPAGARTSGPAWGRWARSFWSSLRGSLPFVLVTGEVPGATI